jgi:hypothetical protein
MLVGGELRILLSPNDYGYVPELSRHCIIIGQGTGWTSHGTDPDNFACIYDSSLNGYRVRNFNLVPVNTLTKIRFRVRNLASQTTF